MYTIRKLPCGCGGNLVLVKGEEVLDQQHQIDQRPIALGLIDHWQEQFGLSPEIVATLKAEAGVLYPLLDLTAADLDITWEASPKCGGTLTLIVNGQPHAALEWIYDPAMIQEGFDAIAANQIKFTPEQLAALKAKAGVIVPKIEMNMAVRYDGDIIMLELNGEQIGGFRGVRTIDDGNLAVQRWIEEGTMPDTFEASVLSQVAALFAPSSTSATDNATAANSRQ